MDNLVEEYYKRYYDEIQYTGVNSLGNYFVHNSVLKLVKKSKGSSFLEIGCGNHPQINDIFFSSKFAICGDIRMLESENRFEYYGKFIQFDSNNLPFKSEVFDAIFMNCLLMHLENPIKTLKEIKRVLKINGNIIGMIPCEGHLALTIFQKLITHKRIYKNTGMNAAYINAIDHISSPKRLMILLKMLFKSVSLKFYPFQIKTLGLNLFIVFSASKQSN